MKESIKKYLGKYKKIFLMLIASILLLMFLFLLMTMFINSNPDIIKEFLEDPKITSEIAPFTIMVALGFIIGLFIIILIIIIFIKILFPNTKAFTSLVLPEEASFLLNIPKEIGKEIKKNNVKKQ